MSLTQHTPETSATTRFWIGVASRDHVKLGESGGFCQLCHGKIAPLKRMRAGDWITYYSPRTGMKEGEPVQAFTAIGQIREGEPYAFEMAPGLIPHRRDVDFRPCEDAPIRPLLQKLSFIHDETRWASPFRFGMFEIPESDFRVIAQAMRVPMGISI